MPNTVFYSVFAMDPMLRALFLRDLFQKVPPKRAYIGDHIVVSTKDLPQEEAFHLQDCYNTPKMDIFTRQMGPDEIKEMDRLLTMIEQGYIKTGHVLPKELVEAKTLKRKIVIA